MTSIGLPNRRPLVFAYFIALVSVLSIALAGCVGYGTYPPSGPAPSPAAVNSSAGEEIIVAGIDWILNRDDVTEPVVVSLPELVKPYRATRIASKIGPLMVNPDESTSSSDIVYHVGRVAIRGDDAEIDIYRPVFNADNDRAVYQLITLDLRGGIRPWHVDRTRPWSLGAFEPPPVHPVRPQ